MATLTRTKSPKTQVLKHLIQNPLLAMRELNNRSFYEFLQFMWPEVSSEDFKDNWHIQFICNELQRLAEAVAEKREKPHDLIINVPPGSTKTIICSIMFPVWCWTKWYWMKFICVSYSSSLSLESAVYSRDLVRSDRFKAVYPELGIKEDKDQKGNFQVTRRWPSKPGRAERIRMGGNRYSTSVGGTLTGFHGHIIIVDDPINPEQAVSEVELNNANRWIDQTLPTRKVDKAVSPTITIMQRLHEEDPTGHLLKKGKTNLRHICIPGEILNYESEVCPKELVKKYKDGLMDPNRLSWKVLKDLEEDLGQYGYAGQIGQAPTPPAGGMFQVDHFTVIERPPPETMIEQIIRYWDKAGTKQIGKKGKNAAFTAGVKMAKLKNEQVWVVLDVVRGRWASNEREKVIKNTAQADGKDVHIWIEQEPGSGGKESAESTITNLAGFVVRAERPQGDKVYRADPYSVQVNNGNVRLLRGDWNKDFKEEHRYFPHSAYKDQVDSAGGAFAKLTNTKQARVFGQSRRR